MDVRSRAGQSAVRHGNLRTGPDIWNASVRVLDAAVEQSYKGAKEVKCSEFFTALITSMASL